VTRESRRELRKAKRIPRRQAAWVVLDGGCAHVPCVLWDISEAGARIAAAHAGALPDVFGLFLTKDGKSRRFCHVVWRRGGQLGVRFVDEDVANIDLDPLPRWMRRKPAAFAPAAKTAAQSQELDTSQILLPGYGPQVALEGSSGRPLRLSSIAGGMLVLLVAATALFVLADIQDEADWAVAVCTSAGNFCQHPEWTGAAAIVMFVVYLMLRGTEDWER
jgi:PilZ domain